MNSSFLFNGNIKASCTGCGACAQICANSAITMHEDSEGFLFPYINSEKCLRCGLCDKRCPVNSKGHYAVVGERQTYLLATNKYRQDSKECATIGLCTMLSLYAFSHGWAVFGVVLDETSWKSYHKLAQTKDDILAFRNSKYVQSNTIDTYSDVKRQLKTNHRVLYIGTPCQIAGLKAYLGRKYENLFTIDLFCHGAYSYKLIQKEVEYWEKKYNGVISKFRFRSKRRYPWIAGGIINFDVKFNSGGKKHIEVLGQGSPTYSCFAYSGDGVNYNLRESCYTCPFRDKERYGDLSIGDAWMLHKKYSQIFTVRNCKTGISSIFVNSSSGEYLLNLIGNVIEKIFINKEDAFSQEALLPSNREIPKQRYDLYCNLNSTDYYKLVEKSLNTNLLADLEKKKKSLRKMRIKNLVKLILFYDSWKSLI